MSQRPDPDGVIRKYVHTDYTVDKALRPDDAKRLAKVCGMFGSSHAGERASAALEADQLVRQAGETWDSVIGPKPELPPSISDWKGLVRFCANHAQLLNSRERDFVHTLARYHTEPSPKQMAWLRVIVARLREVAA